MLMKLNVNIFRSYVLSKFNLKKEYVVIPIIPIWHTFTFKIKQLYLLPYWQNITEKIFNQKRIQKEKYEMKGENKTTIKTKNNRVIYEH